METPALYQLMGAYFHEDWVLDGTEVETVDAFLKGEPDLAPGLAREIALLLEMYPTEPQLEDALDKLGSAYWADPADGGYRGFLERVTARARLTSAGGT